MANGDFTLVKTANGTDTSGIAASFSKSKAISSVADHYDTVIALTTSATDIFAIGTAGKGTLAGFSEFIVENLDTVNTVELGLIDGTSKGIGLKIPPGMIIDLASIQIDANTSGSSTFTFTPLTKVTAKFTSVSGATNAKIRIFALN